MNVDIIGKKLLVLGGTKISCEIIRKAKRMGLNVVVADYNKPQDSPGKLIANEAFLVSATDVDAIVNLIKQEKIDGVITGFADVLLPYYAEICEKAELPCYATKEQFEILINKNKYMYLFKEYHIPVPCGYNVDSIDACKNIEINFPIIVKPDDSSGSRGVKVCYNKSDLVEGYLEALKFSRSSVVRVEEFLNGPEVTAFFIIEDGDPHFVALANRHVENNQGPSVTALPIGYTFPSKYTDKYAKVVAPKVNNFLQDIGIENGLLFMQCIVTDGIPKVYDVGLRLSGSLEYHILEKLCNFNPLEMLIKHAITGKMGTIKNKVCPKMNGLYGWNISFLLKPGRIERIVGIEKINSIPGVIHTFIAHEHGDSILESEKGLLKQICFRVLGASNTKEEMGRSVKMITETFKVFDIHKNNLLLPTLEFNKYIGYLE